jgi:type II secretion system protein J
LIEILVAVGIFAIVLLAIHGVFFGALHLRAKTVQATDDLLPVDLAVAIMKRDLANIVPPGGGVQASMLVGSMNSGNSAGLIKGPEISLTQPIALEIFSANGVLSDDFPWGDVQKVDYLLQDPTNRSSALGKDLVRSATRNLLATGVNEADQRSLLADVEGLQFSFYDGTNWLDIWDSTVNTAMPTAVKVLVQRVSGDLENKIITPVEFVVPVVTQARTNSGAGGAG